jgi:DNA-binding NtrC family response regulator
MPLPMTLVPRTAVPRMPTLLIVEDDALILECAEMMISDFGYTTLTASDVDEAMKLINAPGQIDGMMTDIRLKAALQGGIDLGWRAVSVRPELRVLYATGSGRTPQIADGFVPNACFLQKPYTENLLQAALANLFSWQA